MLDGGWAIYPGGPTDVSALGQGLLRAQTGRIDPLDPAMARARRRFWTWAAHECNSFTRFYLALLGQISYDECPCVPPEIVLIPARLNFSLSAMSAWTRTIVVPLSIMSFYKPVRRLEPDRGIAELFRPIGHAVARGRPPGSRGRTSSWGWTALLKWLDRRVPGALRKPAVRTAHRWMLDHCENTDGLGAIFPPMVYSIIALRCSGLRA